MLKRPAASESDTSAPQRTVKAALSCLSVYDLHKRLINDYMVHYGKTALLKRNASGDRQDIDVIRENHRFLWDEDDTPESWETKLAKKYYDKLFKEYCICDLSRYKENKIAMRWRTEQEVVNGKGQFSCGNKTCREAEGLRTWEVNFAYKEQEEKKNALVKLRLCPECTYKLNYHHKKREVTRNKKNKRHTCEEESPPSKRKKKVQETQEESEDKKQHANTDETTHDNDSDSEDESKVWRAGKAASEEKSRDEEFQEYLEELLL